MCVEFRRLARLHVDVDELDRVVLDDIAWIRIAPEHHLRGLFLPDKEAVTLQVRVLEDAMLHIEGDVLDMARVLGNQALGNGQDGCVDAKLAVCAQDARALLPHRLHVAEIGFVRNPRTLLPIVLDRRPVWRRGDDKIDAGIRKARKHLGGVSDQQTMGKFGGPSHLHLRGPDESSLT